MRKKARPPVLAGSQLPQKKYDIEVVDPFSIIQV
jgi:hypothetical protein